MLKIIFYNDRYPKKGPQHFYAIVYFVYNLRDTYDPEIRSVTLANLLDSTILVKDDFGREGGFFLFHYFTLNTRLEPSVTNAIEYSFYCTPSRKSLVKGERFIRFEEEQEFIEVFKGDFN
jgi:hypothetical protein